MSGHAHGYRRIPSDRMPRPFRPRDLSKDRRRVIFAPLRLRVKQTDLINRVSETASLSGPGSHLAVGGGRAVLRHGLEGPPGERHRKGTGSCESRRLFCG